MQGIVFANIPPNATILVNLLGSARTINTYSGSVFDTDPSNQLRERLLWNVPDASSFTVTGSGQFQGGLLVGNPASTTTISLPGTNGRIFTTGSLTHASPGSKLHAYPFDGDLPDCGAPPVPSGSTTVTKTDPEGNPLSGAVFQLWHETNDVPGLQTDGTNPDTQVGEPCTTPAEGVCSADDLPFGTYYWQEVSAPDGYELPKNPVTTVVLSERCPHVDVTVNDAKCPPKKPKPKPCKPEGYKPEPCEAEPGH